MGDCGGRNTQLPTNLQQGHSQDGTGGRSSDISESEVLTCVEVLELTELRPPGRHYVGGSRIAVESSLPISYNPSQKILKKGGQS